MRQTGECGGVAMVCLCLSVTLDYHSYFCFSTVHSNNASRWPSVGTSSDVEEEEEEKDVNMSIESEELDAGDYAGFLEEAEALRMQTESTAGGSTST